MRAIDTDHFRARAVCRNSAAEEARTLKWSHVDFEMGLIPIRDSKDAGVIRPTPLFEDLRNVLLETPESQRNGFVLSRDILSTTTANIYNKMKQAIGRTEWEIWPRLRQNLRSSCENDLLDQGIPEHTVVVWIGHSVNTSRSHYQKTKQSTNLMAIENIRF